MRPTPSSLAPLGLMLLAACAPTPPPPEELEAALKPDPILTPRQICQRAYTRITTTTTEDGLTLSVVRVNDWLPDVLAACPQYANHLLWTTPDGTTLPWSAWPSDKQKRLTDWYRIYLAHGDGDAHVPGETGDSRDHLIELSEGIAFDLFAVNAAHALAREVRHELPWSLLDFPDSNLDAIFSSEEYATPVQAAADVDPTTPAFPVGTYLLPFWRYSVRYVDRPQDGYDFVRGLASMTGQDMVASTPDQTLANLSLWTAQNVEHGWGIPSLPYPQNLAGRLHRSAVPWDATLLRVVGGLGCHTTRDLLVDLARSVNIPLRSVYHPSRAVPPYTTTIGHAAAVYRWDSPAMRVLEHADDLNAIGNYPDGGEPLWDLSAAHAWRYFVTLWQTPAELAASGFILAPGLPTMRNDSSVETAPDGSPLRRQRAYRTYGRLLGVYGSETDATSGATWFAALDRPAMWLGSEHAPFTGPGPAVRYYCGSRTPDGAIPDYIVAAMAANYPTVATSLTAMRPYVEQLESYVRQAGSCAALLATRSAFHTTSSPNGWRE